MSLMNNIIYNTYQRHLPTSLLGITSLLMSAMTLVGCSSSGDTPDAPDNGGHSISFAANNDNTEAVSRAPKTTSLSSLGHKEILVYGYKTIDGAMQNVMPGYTLKYTDNSANSTTTNTTGWEYVAQGKDYLGLDQEIKYWDGNSTDYRFFAVLSKFKDNLRYDDSAISASTNVTTKGSFSMSFTGLEYYTHDSIGTYRNSSNAEVSESDIPMYGTLWQGDPAEYYNKPVPLSFVKPYALVRLVFERPNGTSSTQLGKEGDTTYPITFGPKGGELAGDGTVDVSWGMASTRETATATAGTKTLTTMTLQPVSLINEETRYQAWPEYLMIPVVSTVDFVCTAYVHTKNSSGADIFDKREAVIPATYMQWKPGYQYTYVFKITSNNSLEFSHAIEVYTKWQAGYTDETHW